MLNQAGQTRLRFARSILFSAVQSSTQLGIFGWGREFKLEAHFEGAVDPLTGMIVNLVHVDRWLDEVIAPFRRKTTPTTERLATQFFNDLQACLKRDRCSAKLAKVVLHEDSNTFIAIHETV
jgi:6-pyruvoyl-tetrahydropterin synthase